MSIRLKFTLLMLGLLVLAAGAITTVSLVFQGNSLRSEAILRGQSIAVNLAAPVAEALLVQNDILVIGLCVSTTKDHVGVAYAAVLDEAGVVKGHGSPAALGKPLEFSPEAQIEAGTERAVVMEGLSSGLRVWDIAVPLILKGSNTRMGTAHVGILRDAVEGQIRQSLMALGGIAAFILVLGVGLAWATVGLSVRPLQRLSEASRKVGQGNLDVKVDVRGKDELAQFAQNFNAMVSGLKEAEEKKLLQQRLESELFMARQIQASLLPQERPADARLELDFVCEPAKELGGDFCDWFELPQGKGYGLVIADVSGKGVPAALHMANLRALFRVVAKEASSAREGIIKVNELAYADLKGESFVTCVYAVYAPETGKLSFVNAGHDPIFVKEPGGRVRSFDSSTVPLGLAQGGEFADAAQEIELSLKGGGTLLMFTDGVTEAMNAKDEQFTLQRVKAGLMQGQGASQICSSMVEAVREHAAGHEQSDDLTLLCLRAV